MLEPVLVVVHLHSEWFLLVSWDEPRNSCLAILIVAVLLVVTARCLLLFGLLGNILGEFQCNGTDLLCALLNYAVPPWLPAGAREQTLPSSPFFFSKELVMLATEVFSSK